MSIHARSLPRAARENPSRGMYFAFLTTGARLIRLLLQIDRLNLEGYANLDHWVAELDQRIEGILLQRVTHVIQLFCSEFERADDHDSRREILSRRDKRAKNDKVCRNITAYVMLLTVR